MADITFEGETADLIRRLRASPDVPGIEGLAELRAEISKWEAHQSTDDEAAALAPRQKRRRRKRRKLALIAAWVVAGLGLALWRLLA